MQVYYKNSSSASFLCIVGCLVGVCGLIAFIDMQDYQYFLVAALGFVFFYLGNLRGSKADFNHWLEGQTEKTFEKKIKSSISFAMEKYQECPNKYTYEYINGLNPEAGSYIKKDRAEGRRKSLLQGKNK